MFSKNNKIGKGITSVPVAGAPSILSVSATVTGRISIEEDLRIDGTVEGDIHGKGKVVVGPEGFVKGNIKSRSVELTGRMSGDIAVSDIVILRAASYYEGQITARNIEIESGARFYGNCKMEESAKEGISVNAEPAGAGDPASASGKEDRVNT